MKLYIMRHGTTDWNLAKRLQGNSDTSLNEEGRELAKITSKALEAVSFDIIYSSPLSRAKETAEIIRADRDIKIITDDRLIEMGFGVNEGKYPKERTLGVEVFFTEPEKYVAKEGAETIEALCARTRDFIETVIVPLSMERPDATVLISGHGAMNKALMTTLEHREKKDFWAGAWQKNCSLFIYEIKGRKFKLIEEGKVFY